MSVRTLEKAIGALPSRTWTVDDLAELRRAAGPRLGAGERDVFTRLLKSDWRRFDERARRALEIFAGTIAPDLEPTRFVFREQRSTGIVEQSALAFVSPTIGFVVVDDETSSLWRIRSTAGGGEIEHEQLKTKAKKMTGLEGVAYDDGMVYVVSENHSAVWRIPLETTGETVTLGTPDKLGELPAIGAREDKGWEGLTILPAALSPDKTKRLLAVNERDPRGIGVFNPRTLELDAFVELPESVDARDLSDIAVDPRTGRVFLLSDESNAVYEVELRLTTEHLGPGPLDERWSIVPVGTFELPRVLGKDPQAEGIAVDAEGSLWVSWEQGAGIARFDRA